MTYEEIVDYVRNIYENADARQIFEHIAIQVNIIGEGSGIFYIEVAERHICVEPYDYYDHDVLVVTDWPTIKAVEEGELKFEDAVEQGVFYIEGNMQKVEQLRKITCIKKKRRTTKKDNK